MQTSFLDPNVCIYIYIYLFDKKNEEDRKCHEDDSLKGINIPGNTHKDGGHRKEQVWIPRGKRLVIR